MSHVFDPVPNRKSRPTLLIRESKRVDGKSQKRIENKLARRHLGEGSVVLYDISSSSYYGRTCPLAVYESGAVSGAKSEGV